MSALGMGWTGLLDSNSPSTPTPGADVSVSVAKGCTGAWYDKINPFCASVSAGGIDVGFWIIAAILIILFILIAFSPGTIRHFV